uniref:Uncharacterized protein n=1 Tax=Anopheles christyi TaxID=43041 RepID=A0A182KIK6_9DIPT
MAGVDGRGSMGSIDGRGGVRGVDGRGGVGNDGWGGMGNDGLGVDGRGRLADDSVESVHIIGGVVDGAHGTVRLDEGVLALHDITVAALDLRLDISGQTIVNTIVVGVFGVSVVVSLVFSGERDHTSGGNSEHSQAHKRFEESHFRWVVGCFKASFALQLGRVLNCE